MALQDGERVGIDGNALLGEAADLLKRLEWSGGDEREICPSCKWPSPYKAEDNGGHDSACELKRVMSKLEFWR